MAVADEQQKRFEALALPHLDAAFNLARWLTRNDHDAQDVVQDAFMRAMRYFGSFRGENARGWLLQIVRNTCFSWMKENRPTEIVAFEDNEEIIEEMPASTADEPHVIVARRADAEQIDRAIAALPIAYREVLVLREIEDFSYTEIAKIADIPVGTVMSRLSRARSLLRKALTTTGRPVLRTVARQRT